MASTSKSYYVYAGKFVRSQHAVTIDETWGPYSLASAKQFARIGSQTGKKMRIVSRGAHGFMIRVYSKGERIYPHTKGETEGMRAAEIPAGLRKRGKRNPVSFKDLGFSPTGTKITGAVDPQDIRYIHAWADNRYLGKVMDTGATWQAFTPSGSSTTHQTLHDAVAKLAGVCKPSRASATVAGFTACNPNTDEEDGFYAYLVNLEQIALGKKGGEFKTSIMRGRGMKAVPLTVQVWPKAPTGKTIYIIGKKKYTKTSSAAAAIANLYKKIGSRNPVKRAAKKNSSSSSAIPGHAIVISKLGKKYIASMGDPTLASSRLLTGTLTMQQMRDWVDDNVGTKYSASHCMDISGEGFLMGRGRWPMERRNAR